MDESVYSEFFCSSPEGMGCVLLEPPVPVDLPIEEQVWAIFERGVLSECNDALARLYGRGSAAEIIGVRLAELMNPDDALHREFFNSFIRSGYQLLGAESRRRDGNGGERFYLSSLVGHIENGDLTRIWGTRLDVTESKATASAASHLAAIVTSSDDAIISKTLNGIITSWNLGAERIFGYTAEEAIGRPVTMLMPDERIHEEVHILSKIQSGERIEHFETIRRRKDGTDIIVSLTVSPIFDPTGSIIGASKIARDITEKRRAEVIAERYRELSMRARDIILFIEQETGRIVEANRSAEVAYGYSREELTERSIADLRAPETLNELEEQYAGADRGGVQFETIHNRRDGTRFPVEVSAIGSTVGGRRLIVSIIRDISERRQHEEELAHNQLMLALAMRSSQMGAWEHDIATGLVTWSEELEDIFGFARGEFPGGRNNFYQLVHPDDREALNSEVHRAIAERRPYSVDFRFVHKDGSVRWMEGRGEAVYTADGKPVRVYGIGIDITARRRTEERLSLVARISELIRSTEDAGELLYQVAKAIGEHLETRRCFFNEIDIDADREYVHRDHCRGVESVAGVHRISDYSPITSAEIAAGLTIVNRDSKTDPRTSGLFEQVYELHGERAYVAVPLMREGKWVASLWVSDDAPRDWAAQEISLLETIAERTWTAVEKLRIDLAFRESERQYRSLLESIDQGYCIIQMLFDEADNPIDYRFLTVNPAFSRLTGLPENAAGRTILEMVPDLEDFWIETYGRVALTGEPVRFEDRSVPLQRWFDVSALRVGDPADRQVALLFSNTTERKLAEQALRDSEQRYRFAIRATYDVVWDWDKVKDEIVWGEALHTVFGYPPEQAGSAIKEAFKWWTDRIHPDDRERVGKSFQKASEGGTQEWIEGYRFRRADGTYADVTDAAFIEYNDEGIPIRLVGAMRDITERRAAEEALIRAQRKAADEYHTLLERIVPLGQTLGTARDLPAIYRSLLEFVRTSMPCSAFFVSFYDEAASLRTAAFAWGEDGEVDIATLPPMRLAPDGGPNSQAVFGRKAVIIDQYMERMRGKPHLVLQENGNDPNSSVAVPMVVGGRVLGTIEVQAYEAGAFRNDHVVALEMVANLAAVAIENVRLLEIEAKARTDAEAANRMKDEFLSILSHELRTPLNAMLGWVKMLRAGILDEEKSAKGLEVIERNTRQQSSLIEDLLDVSRIISGKMRIENELVDLAAITTEVAETLRPLAVSKRVEFVYHPSPEPVFVNGDSVRLRQLVTNLMQNAIKFTPGGGRVTLSIDASGESVTVRVADTGVGISADFLPQIFDRFTQADASTRRSYTGLGLGLTLVRNIAELHGGSVRAESEGEGRGSCFTFELPLANDHLPANDPPAVMPGRSGLLADLRILVVDDNVESITPLQLFLENERADVAVAASAGEALQMLGAGSFDLLISDIGLPSLDGFELIRQVRAGVNGHRDVPAIALTAYASADARQRAAAAGFHHYLPKPANFEDLLEVIRSFPHFRGR